MIIQYRRYTTSELLKILTGEQIYFSRHSFFDRSSNRGPDIIRLSMKQNTCAGFELSVVCEIHNNMESMWDVLEEQGFKQDSDSFVFKKTWNISLKHGKDAGCLVNTLVGTLKLALEESPILLYSSFIYRSLQDYHNFINSNCPKVDINELMFYLGYHQEYAGAGEDISCMVAPYKRGMWAAWISGDTIIPLFPGEFAARHFLNNRVRNSQPFAKIAVSTIPSMVKGVRPQVYLLADPARTVNERLAWLETEIDSIRGGLKKAVY